MYKPVNWSPFATNPIDHLDGRTTLNLITPEGEPVRILNEAGKGFIVYIDKQRFLTGFENVNCCYFLNTSEVGMDKG